MTTARLRDELCAWLLKPPYSGVIWLAWLYVVIADVCFFKGPFAGDLIWFDDRVRMVRILDWLNGQGWYDRTIWRANLPEGFHTIWSRVVDLPIAGVIAAFQGFAGQRPAAMIAAIIIPLIQVLLLFGAASYFARPLVGRKYARLVTLYVLFTSALNPEYFTLAGFQIGAVSHHSWYVLLCLMLFGTMSRLIIASAIRHVVLAGLSIGALLMVGIEALPLIAGACGLIAVIGWLHQRPRLILDASRATALGALVGLALLPTNQPFDQWFTPSFAEPSIVGPILLGAAAFFFGAQFFILRKFGRSASLVLTVLVGLMIAAGLIYLFPPLLDGAAAALTPEERRLAAADHPEAISIWRLSKNGVDYLRMIVPPLLATGFAAWRIRKEWRVQRRALLIFYAGLVVLSFGMASVYSRYFHYVGLTVSPLLLLFWLTATKHMWRNEFFALKSFGLYLMLGPLWLWLIPAANYNEHFGTNVLLFPFKFQTETDVCDMRSFGDFLNTRYTADQTIIVPIYSSDKFLFHTKLRIFFLASFPSNNKFLTAKTFYETTSPDTARAIAREHGINLVALCKKSYHISPETTFTNRLLAPRMNFGQQLVTGKQPDWLKPVETGTETPWLLFEVDRSKL